MRHVFSVFNEHIVRHCPKQTEEIFCTRQKCSAVKHWQNMTKRVNKWIQFGNLLPIAPKQYLESQYKNSKERANTRTVANQIQEVERPANSEGNVVQNIVLLDVNTVRVKIYLNVAIYLGDDNKTRHWPSQEFWFWSGNYCLKIEVTVAHWL